MTHFRLVTRKGEERSIQVEQGLSVMELIRNAGVDELPALCGGCRSCATCHVYVEGEDVSRLPAQSEDEEELLESSDNRQVNSRLSCQLFLAEGIQDLTVIIAPED